MTEFIQLTAPTGDPLYLYPPAVTAVWEETAGTASRGGFPGIPHEPGRVVRHTRIEASSADGSAFRVEEPAAVVVELVELAKAQAAFRRRPRIWRKVRRVLAERSAA